MPGIRYIAIFQIRQIVLTNFLTFIFHPINFLRPHKISKVGFPIFTIYFQVIRILCNTLYVLSIMSGSWAIETMVHWRVAHTLRQARLIGFHRVIIVGVKLVLVPRVRVLTYCLLQRNHRIWILVVILASRWIIPILRLADWNCLLLVVSPGVSFWLVARIAIVVVLGRGIIMRVTFPVIVEVIIALGIVDVIIALGIVGSYWD
jgi:hypothetical protein